MAGTVGTDLAFFTNGATDSSCDATTNWLTLPTTDADFMIQGTACNSAKVSKTTYTSVYTFGSPVNLTNQNIYVWMLMLTPGIMGTKSAGGLRVRVEDGSANYGEWYVDGSDTYPGGWVCYCVNCDSAYSAKSATAPTKTAITKAGVVCYTTASSSKINFFWDAMRYGTYLSIYGGTSTTPTQISDLYDSDNSTTNKYGVITKYMGVYLVQGKLKIGDASGTNATYFKDTSGSVAVFRRNPVYAAAGAVLYDNAASPVVLPYRHEIVFQGNGTGSTEIYFGEKVGTAGINGLIFKSESDNYRYALTMSNTNITKFGVYGTVFQDADTTTGQAYNANKEFVSTQWVRCNEVTASNGIVSGCVFSTSPARALKLSSATHYYSSNTFVNCAQALHINTADTYAISGFVFSGNQYDLENSSGGSVTVNATSCTGLSTEFTTLSTPKAQSYNNTGTAYVDESTAADNDTPYDMNVLSDTTPEANDAYLFGHASVKFTSLIFQMAIPATATWTITWEYSTGAGTWSALSGVTDNTTGFTAAVGGKKVTWTDPGAGWVTATYNSITAYWIRARISSYTSRTIAPKGTRVFLQDATDRITLNQTVTLTVTCKDDLGLAIENVRVRVEKTDGTLISNGLTNSSGVYTDATYSYPGSDVNVNVIARLKGYINYSSTSTITSLGLNVPATMPVDDAINLP